MWVDVDVWGTFRRFFGILDQANGSRKVASANPARGRTRYCLQPAPLRLEREVVEDGHEIRRLRASVGDGADLHSGGWPATCRPNPCWSQRRGWREPRTPCRHTS